MQNKINKRAAIELSIGTMVVIVLAMAMLILGLVLVKNIFSGATSSVDTINDNVKAQINQLFNDNNQKVAVLLPGNSVEIKKGTSFGVAFGVKDVTEGTSTTNNFAYHVDATSIDNKCSGLTTGAAQDYVYLARTGSFTLTPGATYNQIFKIKPSTEAPLCEVAYNLVVTKNGAAYDTQQFFVKITA